MLMELVIRGCSSVGRAVDSRSKGHVFDSRLPHCYLVECLLVSYKCKLHLLVESVGSIPTTLTDNSSIMSPVSSMDRA